MDQEKLAEIINTAVSKALDTQSRTHAQQMTALQETIDQKLEMVQNANKSENGSVKQEPQQSGPPDNASDTSSSSDVEFIKQFVNPKFSTSDANSKYAYERLYKIQAKLEAAIPKLAYSKTDGDQQGPPSHNYLKWQTALLKYFKSISPVLAEATAWFLNSADIDLFIQGKEPNYPTLDQADYPDLVRLQAMTALQSTVSSDFDHLLDTESMVDIFPSLLRIHCTCRPNSDDDRAEELISFWDMKMTATQTVSQFGSALLKAMKHYNDTSPKDKISQPQLIATLKNGVRKGAQRERFAAALLTMKYKVKNPEFHTMLLWLDHNCDWSKPLTPLPESPAVSAVRARGGGGGGKGAGRGRGRGGKGNQGRPQRGGKGVEPDGSVTWKESYYKVQDEDGNDTITKEVKDVRKQRPCFTKFQDGACNDPDCPYSHEFNVYDRTERSKASQVSTAAGQRDTKQDTKQESEPPAPTQTSHAANIDDDFDFAYDLGFKSSYGVSSVSVDLPTRFSKNSNPKLYLSAIPIISILICLFPFWQNVFPQYIILITLILVSILNLQIFSKHPLSASAAAWPKATYQTILDCGCTFNMSGDINLFDPQSMTKIDERISLAESGEHANATHFGKMNVGGRWLDALYVPNFKQTMISMGYLEKMGLRYVVEGNIRRFLFSNNTVFLSFMLTSNNLYTLVSHSSSSSQ